MPRPLRRDALTVVLSPLAPALGDVDVNLRRHRARIALAARAAADLIVFPELSLTGYLLQDLVADCAQAPSTSSVLEALRRASRRTAVAAGFVERGPGGVLYNAAGCWIAGRLASLHRKVYLPTYGMFDEARDFGAGETFRAFEAPWGRTGILICEDFWHLSSSYLLAQQGMEVLVVMANSPTKGIDASPVPASETAWVDLARTVARFLACYVVYVNRSGHEEGRRYGGACFAVDPAGRVTARRRAGRPGDLTVRLPLQALRRSRIAYPLLRDEKLDLVRRELERIAVARHGAS